jgi:N6-L-threonylcarbamoyladenine synthase
MVLLAIETSCDDTAAAVIENGIPRSNIVSSQYVHNQFGGVVPEMASREHQKNIIHVAHTALKASGFELKDLNAIAFTRGPGLPGSLMVGASFAKGLALALNIPLISVHHMEAHILSLLIGEHCPTFPFLCLVVSGGHTLLVLVRAWNSMEVLGTTKDDSVGEAFDKCAKILGLGYPGGKLIDDLAKNGDSDAFSFPVARIPGYDFSYSGVKTAFLYFVQSKESAWLEAQKPHICASIQKALLRPLLDKLKQAIRETGIRCIGLAGGVAANSSLRWQLAEMGKEMGCDVFVPDFQYCTDNAGMIGRAAVFKYEQAAFSELSITTEPRLKIGS